MRKRGPNRSDEEWLELIIKCRQSGLTDKEWCHQNNINRSTFYNVVKRLEEKACCIPDTAYPQHKSFQEVVPLAVQDDTVLFPSLETSSNDLAETKISEPKVAIHLTFRDVHLEIADHTDPSTIAAVLQTLRYLC